MRNKATAVIGGMLLFFCPLAGVILLLWVFWDDLF